MKNTTMATSAGAGGIRALMAGSVRLIADLQAPSGAYPASPTFSAYAGYSWFRDGAFTADAMSQAGEVQSAAAFFDWCATGLLARAGQIAGIVAATRQGRPPADLHMLPARLTLAGADGDADWWDFQLDGYGTWLWALGEHLARHGGPAPDRWREAAAHTVDYLAVSWRRPCYDWWEEHVEQIHISTLGTISAGLRAAAESGLLDAAHTARARRTVTDIDAMLLTAGVADGHLTKWVGNGAVDGSLAAVIAPLAVLDPRSQVAGATVAAIENDLAFGSGVHRFTADTFYGGGQWPLLSCFLGLAHVALGNSQRAHELLEWAASTAGEAGLLPEQVAGHLLAPAFRQEWIDRWGPVARPLLWSHAMFLKLALTLGYTVPHETDAA